MVYFTPDFETSPDRLSPDLFVDYRRAFQRVSWGNDHFADGTFHLLFGQLPNIRNIRISKGDGWLDPRVHVCYLSPSGTGKGTGSSFASTMAMKLGLFWQNASKVTDSALIGTNMESGDIDYGWLYDEKWKLNVLAMTEATSIMKEKPGQHDQEVMNLLQQVMNPMDSADATIVKKIGFGEPITVMPRLSIFMTTYPPQNLSDIIVNRGLLQRMYLAVNTVSEKEKLVNLRKVPYAAMKEYKDQGPNIPSIIKRFKKIDSYYKGIDVMHFSQEASKAVDIYTSKLYGYTLNIHPYVAEKLQGFIARFMDLHMKLAMHWACMNLHDEVKGEDAGMAAFETSFLFRKLIGFLEWNMVIPREYHKKADEATRRVTSAFRMIHRKMNGGWVMREDLMAHLVRQYHITPQSADQTIDFTKRLWILEESTKRYKHTDPKTGESAAREATFLRLSQRSSSDTE